MYFDLFFWLTARAYVRARAKFRSYKARCSGVTGGTAGVSGGLTVGGRFGWNGGVGIGGGVCAGVSPGGGGGAGGTGSGRATSGGGAGGSTRGSGSRLSVLLMASVRRQGYIEVGQGERLTRHESGVTQQHVGINATD